MSNAEQLPLHFEFRTNQTFQDFYPGNNQELIDNLQRCLSGSGESLVFIWGKTGQGKSHLLQACCRDAQRLGLTSFYLDLDRLAAISSDIFCDLDACDLVCIDNIESLVGNVDWETAFFNFFNRHRDQGHRLIITSCTPPKAIAIDLPDLKTRLSWGLVLKIQPLDENDKIAALRMKARLMGLELSQQVGRYLLTHASRDLASLWHLLSELDQASLAAQRKLTIPFLKQILSQRHV